MSNSSIPRPEARRAPAAPADGRHAASSCAATVVLRVKSPVLRALGRGPAEPGVCGVREGLPSLHRCRRCLQCSAMPCKAGRLGWVQGCKEAALPGRCPQGTLSGRHGPALQRVLATFSACNEAASKFVRQDDSAELSGTAQPEPSSVPHSLARVTTAWDIEASSPPGRAEPRPGVRGQARHSHAQPDPLQ
jgi:hypothetical protein